MMHELLSIGLGNGRIRKIYIRHWVGYSSTTRSLVDLSGNPKDLTNYSAAAKMKRNYNSDSADTTDFAVAIQPTDGIVTLSLTNQQTNALRVGNYVYDVEISFVDSNGSTVVERVLEGKIRK